jgi:hypothetical protein
MQASLAKLLLAFVLATPSSSTIHFHGTDRLPRGSGEATIERVGTSLRIHIELNDMKPATLFGGDFNTYVIWTMSSPEDVQNIGECALVGDRCRLDALVTDNPTSLFVTAEPHFLVKVPSRFVVLEPESDVSGSSYTGERPTYNYERDTLKNAMQAKGVVDNRMRQALTAVRLARRSGAEELAPEEFRAARMHLQSMLADASREPAVIEMQSRETVRLAVAAQQIANLRARQRD